MTIPVCIACAAFVSAAIATTTLASAAPADALPNHPALLAPLTPSSTFPRFTPAELEAAGYPDHKHVFSYPDYEPFVDSDGVTYGLLSLARRTQIFPREGLLLSEGEVSYRQTRLRYFYPIEAFQVMPMVEFMDWAMRELTILLDHDPGDTLRVVSPVDLEDYQWRTGFGYHRLYWDDGEVIIIEPAQILTTRGLASHVAFHLTAARLIRSLANQEPLPKWLLDGLASYLAEDGCHFLSYLTPFRGRQPVILTPENTETILSSPPHEDQATDLYQYRVAGYSAFLMAWELVEHRGGLAKVRALLARVGQGEPIDEVCLDLYGLDLAGLTADLDPTGRPEPVGDAWHGRRPELPPSP